MASHHTVFYICFSLNTKSGKYLIPLIMQGSNNCCLYQDHTVTVALYSSLVNRLQILYLAVVKR